MHHSVKLKPDPVQRSHLARPAGTPVAATFTLHDGQWFASIGGEGRDPPPRSARDQAWPSTACWSV